MADMFGENIFDVFEENDVSEKKKKSKKRKKEEAVPSISADKPQLGEKRDFKSDVAELGLDYVDMSTKKAKVEDTIER